MQALYDFNFIFSFMEQDTVSKIFVNKNWVGSRAAEENNSIVYKHGKTVFKTASFADK